MKVNIFTVIGIIFFVVVVSLACHHIHDDGVQMYLTLLGLISIVFVIIGSIWKD